MFEKGIDSNPYSNVDFNPSRIVQDPHNTAELAVEPKPYLYGIVGIPHARTPSLSFGSPPASPDRTQFKHDPYQDVAPTLPSVEPVDYLDTQHTSTPPLLYTLPTTHISPEPSIAPSSYSVAAISDLGTSAITRPSPARAPSSGSASRPHTGGSLASRCSMSSTGHIPGPTHRRTRRNGSLSDEHSTGGGGSGRPVSPRTLMLANWNPSTDGISLDVDSPMPAVAPAEYRERRGSVVI